MSRPTFTPTPVRRAVDVLVTATKEKRKVLTSVEQLKEALVIASVKETGYLQTQQQLTQANAQLAATLQARDKEIAALKAKYEPPVPQPAGPANDEAAPERAPRQPVEVSEGGTPD